MPVSTIVLIAMTVIVAILAVYRNLVARNEDDFVHLSDPSGKVIQAQQKTDRSINQVERIGIALTIATAVYGVALFAIYMYGILVGRGQI